MAMKLGCHDDGTRKSNEKDKQRGCNDNNGTRGFMTRKDGTRDRHEKDEARSIHDKNGTLVVIHKTLYIVSWQEQNTWLS